METSQMTEMFAKFLKMNELIDRINELKRELAELGESMPKEVRDNLVGLRKSLRNQGFNGHEIGELS